MTNLGIKVEQQPRVDEKFSVKNLLLLCVVVAAGSIGRRADLGHSQTCNCGANSSTPPVAFPGKTSKKKPFSRSKIGKVAGLCTGGIFIPLIVSAIAGPNYSVYGLMVGCVGLAYSLFGNWSKSKDKDMWDLTAFGMTLAGALLSLFGIICPVDSV